MAKKKSKPKKKQKKSENEVPFTVQTRVSAVFIKFYAEQCGYMPPNNCAMVSAQMTEQDRQLQVSYMRNVLSHIVADTNFPYDVYAIVHDKDTYKDKALCGIDTKRNIFLQPAVEKPHSHLVLVTRGTESNGKGKTRSRRSTIGAMLYILALHGLTFRFDSPDADIAEADTNLLLNQGLIALEMQKKQHIRTIVYLTHETTDARDVDGKVQYDRSLVYTNNISFFEYAHTYYADRLCPKFGLDVVEELQEKFYECGANKKDFMYLWEQLPNTLKTVSNRRRFKMHYDDGLDSIIDSIPPYPKCCIFIHGSPNVGKTYNTLNAFKMLGIKVYEAPSTGTGKYDDLQLTHQAFVANDTTSLPDIHNLCDNKPCRLYRRNSGNPLFLGNYVVITSNLALDEWCQRGYRYYTDDQIRALKSRLIDVYIEVGQPPRIKMCNMRGNDKNVAEILRLFANFMQAFKQSISTYVPANQQPLQLIAGKVLPPDILADVTF